jgi:hypothetical protein
MRHLLLICCSLFLPVLPAYCQQNTVSGQVLEADGTQATGVAGATILQTGTTNGVSASADGRFTLTVPGALDSVSLTITFIGYLRQQLWVAAGKSCTIRLVRDNRVSECTMTLYPRLELGLSSGLRYAPYGGSLKLHGSRLIRVPVSASVNYQTNFKENHALSARLTLPPLYRRGPLTIAESVDYQQLHALPAHLDFRSISGAISVNLYRAGGVRVPTLLLGAGHARLRALQPDAVPDNEDYGYIVGLNHGFRIHTIHFYGSAQATRWAGYWQFQGQLMHTFNSGLQAGAAYNQLRSYAEISLLLSRTFF